MDICCPVVGNPGAGLAVVGRIERALPKAFLRMKAYAKLVRPVKCLPLVWQLAPHSHPCPQ